MKKKVEDPNKSYVSMEQHMCPVCCKVHSHDCGILLDKKLKPVFETNTLTGYGFCEEHDKQIKEGYVFLVEIDPNKSVITNETVTIENAYRTGRVISIKKHVFSEVFNDITPSGNIAFIEEPVFTFLTNMVENNQNTKGEEDGNTDK